MTATHDRRRVDLDALAIRWSTGADGLRLQRAPLAPEIRLHLATDATVLWARMEAEAGTALVAPYWASAWLGGQALARYLLDHPDLVTGRRVLDLAAGCGIAGIAAGLAGATAVTANDIDPYAVGAIELNAKANAVQIVATCASMRDQEIEADVVLVGDAFYSETMARTTLSVLQRAAQRGAMVLIGDPDRADLPRERLQILATYSAAAAAAACDAQVEWVHVLQLG